MASVKWLTDSEQAAWRGYILMHQLLNAQVDRDLQADSALSNADYAVLVTLSEDETHQVRMSELAHRIVWSKSRLSHQVSRMEKRGLVERKSCGEDGRGAWLCLTAKGLTAIEKAAPGHVESVRLHFISRLTPAQLKMLTEIAAAVTGPLTEVCDAIEDGELYEEV